MLNTLLLFIFSSFVLTISPGPDLLFVLSTSMQKGWKSGFRLSLGLTTGILIHTLIVVLGVGSVLALNPNILRLIELLGASFLIYLAIQSWKTKHTIIVQPKKKVSQNLYITGFVMNISNPKVSLFFLSFFPGFLFHESWSNAIQFLILGGIFYVQALFVFFSFSILAHRLTNKLQSFKQDDRWNKVQALILFIISLILIYP